MKLWRWQQGRQRQCVYEKFPLWYFRIWKWGFDAYILKYQPDSFLPMHKDVVENAKHWRLNIKLTGFAYFHIQNKVNCGRINFFRPDLYLHALTVYTKTTKLSFGFVKHY